METTTPELQPTTLLTEVEPMKWLDDSNTNLRMVKMKALNFLLKIRKQECLPLIIF